MDLLKISKVLGIFCIFIVVALTVNQFLPGQVNGETKAKRDNSNLAAKALADTNNDIDSILNYDKPIQINEANESEFIDSGTFGNEMLLMESGSSQVTPYVTTSYYQGFEYDFDTQVEVDYAHPNYFSRETSSFYVKDDDGYSLKVTPDSNGKNYDGVQFNFTFSDGTIEGWFYPEGSYSLIPALWMRTTTLNLTTNPSFTEGYMLRLYENKAYIQRRDTTNGWTILTSYNLGEYIEDNWWHMKFEANGTQLNGWVTKNEAFSIIPQISYDIEEDSIKFNYGKPGISVRTSFLGYPTFVDAIEIIFNDGYYDTFEPKNTSNPLIIQGGFKYANIDYFSLSNEKYINNDNGRYSLKATPDSNGKNYDGIQFNQSFADGSIEAWFYPKNSAYLIPALWLRTSTLNPTTNPSFTEGYMLRIYVNIAYIQRRDSTYGWTTLATYNLGELITNKWWHMKFDACGSYLNAWITRDDAFTDEPLFSYDTNFDYIKINRGNPGISLRTNMANSNYPTYVDIVQIRSPDTAPNAYKCFTCVQKAYTGYDGGQTWNLFLDIDEASLKNFMRSHLGILVQFTFAGILLIEQEDGNYKYEYHETKYDGLIQKYSDDNLYIEFDNVKHDGEDMGEYISVKYDDIVGIYNTEGAQGFLDSSDTLITVFKDVGLALLAIWGTFKIATLTQAIASIPTFAKACLIIGIILVVTAIILAITAAIIRAVWV